MNEDRRTYLTIALLFVSALLTVAAVMVSRSTTTPLVIGLASGLVCSCVMASLNRSAGGMQGQ